MPAPTFLVSKVWVQVTASPDPKEPDVTFGVPDESVVPSYALLSVAAVTVMARTVMLAVVVGWVSE